VEKMAKKKKRASSCEPGNNCNVESIVTVDERGQMVLPKELRKKAKIKTGDKLAITSWQKDGEVCCITLMKVEELVDMVKGKLGPVMKEIFLRGGV